MDVGQSVSSASSDASYDSITFWKSGIPSRSAVPSECSGALDVHFDFLSVLGVAQRLAIDLLPITWQPDLDTVGEGGTAKIREATIDLQLNFAFKCMKYSGKDERVVFRDLVAEIAVLGHKSIRTHPNVVRLEGVCFDIPPDTGQVWPVLVFEKTECGDLTRFAASEPGSILSLTDKLRLCVDIGIAVKDLHACGIVHGDLTPQNILIFQNGENNYSAKVSDFGYSTIVADSDTIDMPRTAPWYAPEWHHRGFKIADTLKMDIFSFGILCLWFLFQHVPGFPSMSELEEQKLNGDLSALARSLVKRSTELPAADHIHLDSFFKATIDRNPNMRTSDFACLLQYLGASGGRNPEGESLEIQLTLLDANFEILTSVYQLYLGDYRVRNQIFASLNKRLSGRKLGGLQSQNDAFQLALCYFLGFGVARDVKKSQDIIYQSDGQNDTIDMKIEKVRHDTRTLTFNDGIFQQKFAAGLIHEIEFHRRYDNREPLEKIEHEYMREVGDLRVSLGEAHPLVLMAKSRAALMLNAQGSWKKAMVLNEEILKQSLEVYGKENINTLGIMEGLAVTYHNLGRFDEAQKLDEETLHISQEHLGAEHADVLNRMSQLACTYRERGRLEDAEALFKQVLKIRMSKLGPNNPYTLTSMAQLGWLYRDAGRWKEAENLELRVREARRHILGENHPDTFSSMTNLASTYLAQGRQLEAMDLFSQVTKKSTESFGPNHPDTLSSLGHIGSTLASQGEYKSAEKIQHKAYLGSLEVLGREHPDTVTSMNNLALTYKHLGQWDEAEKLICEVKEIRETSMGKNHPTTLLASSILVLIYIEQGRLKEAEELGSSVLKSKNEALGPDHPDTLRSTTIMGSIYRDEGRLEEAEKEYTSVMEGHELAFGTEHPETLGLKGNLALLYLHQSRFPEADALFTAVIKSQEQVLGSEHPDMITMKANLALAKRYAGNTEDAMELEVDILEISRRTLGQEHPNTLVSMANLATTLADQRNYARSEALMREVVNKSSKIFGPEHPNSLQSRTNLASVLINQKQWDEATALLANVLDIRVRVLGIDHPDTAESAIRWSQILRERERLQESAEISIEASINHHRSPDDAQE